MKISLIIITIILNNYYLKIGATIKEMLSATKILSGSYTNVKIVQLLNQLCMESQVDNLSKDACYGCFFRASNKPSGVPMLLSMAACGDMYLNNSNYGHCQAYLKNATSNLELRSNPTNIYCTFLECVRQVNKDKLIGVCIKEAVGMFSNFTVNNIQLAQLFVNTTACILAKTRCATLNPITGAFQENDISSKLSIPSINAILVNSDYDINIIQLPFGNGIIDECAKYRNVQQATWPSVQC